jgi:hypothetical protein
MKRLILFAGVSAVGCTRSAADASPTAVASAQPSAAAASADTADAAMKALAPSGAASSWRGSYVSQPGSLYVPVDWKNVRWSVPDSSSGLGEGTIRLTLEAAGRIHGVVDGPLGPAVLAGFADDGGVTAAVRREHPEDRGFEGVLVGAVRGARVEGTMRVSPAQADAIRVATFVLTADGVSPH